MTYDPFVWHDGATGGTLIDAAHLNRIEQGIQAAQATADTAAAAGGVSITAPDPSGGDDTAALQPLLLQAQATGGTLILRDGTYRANLATTQAGTQPRIVGQGENVTTLQGTVTTVPVVRFKGGSGSFSGGYLADLTITGSGGTGLEIADACGVTWDRIHLTGTLAEGITFHNESAGGFTEFNAGSAVIDPTVVLPVRYKRTSGNESFHGTGLTQGSVINVHGTGPAIRIDSGAFPYAAPLTATFFTHAANSSLILNSNTTRVASFKGHLAVESQDAGPDIVGATTGNRILLEGTVGGLAAGNLRLGNLYLVDKAYYAQGNLFASYRPVSRATPLAAGTTAIFPDIIGAACLIQVDIIAANYHYAYLLNCWQSPYDPTGVVTVLANSQALNTAGFGAPTFGWSNYGLTISNAAYTSAVIARVTATPTQPTLSADRLGQN